MTDIKTIENTLSRTLDQATASAHTALGQVSSAATQAAKTLDAKGNQLVDAQARLTNGCRTYVQEKPLTALGIAVASGFLLSWAIAKR